MSVARASICDGLTSWQVTRRIGGVADIGKCSPATGLVLHLPTVTYCEINYPDRSNPLMKYAGQLPAPPAG
ncbi:hypothetical protein HH308_10685 [Gordonia sp. TBRC 11910]|uniref:Uncharacterized protein n=1 Tax=Gordonia asplenii TaxID=2725283 RepID=A0A848KU07_9ACTN|nr:hypothetical protein [Gordonia asplenii]NMO01679.1 hypothetical protein [Gordonia asplenii]